MVGKIRSYRIPPKPADPDKMVLLQLKKSARPSKGCQDAKPGGKRLKALMEAPKKLRLQPDVILSRLGVTMIEVGCSIFLKVSGEKITKIAAAETPFTNAQFRMLMEIAQTEIADMFDSPEATLLKSESKCMVKSKTGDAPFVYNTFEQASLITTLLGCCLPTAEMWEAAAGKTTYPWGDSWNTENAKKNAVWEGLGTKPVKTKKPNIFGLYDMAGNVWEWTSTFRKDVMEIGVDDADRLAGVETVMIKGGSWFRTVPEDMEINNRNRFYRCDYSEPHIGFRLFRILQTVKIEGGK